MNKPQPYESIAFHSLCWLVVGNAVGILLAANLLFLAFVLAKAWLDSRLHQDMWARLDKYIAVGKMLFLFILATIPFVMYWASNPDVYPSINPDSGGATGGSLLGSTLVIVAIFVATPVILALKPRHGVGSVAILSLILILHLVWFGLLDHGHRSHHERIQLVSLFSLMIWFPLIWWHLRRYEWPAGAVPWLCAFCVWGGVLLGTALFMFLPGVLEKWKFTNALVGHTHIAMAGMMSSFNVLVLIVLLKETRCRRVLDSFGSFTLWQAGCTIHVLSLLAAGLYEEANHGGLYRSEPILDALYIIRLLAGLMMFAGSTNWFSMAVAERRKSSAMEGNASALKATA